MTSVNDQYGRPDLATALLAALRNSGKDVDALTTDDLAPFEEIHVRGREATRELALLAGLRSGMHVLDLGCGIGGPARMLAVEFGCQVTALDLNESFCRAGEMLTSLVGLDEYVAFRHADAVDMPFENNCFDVVWMQHMAMNIEDKQRLFQEIHRVLAPGGKLALYEVVAGSVSPLRFPVPWANDASISFLCSVSEFRRLIAATGFNQFAWDDNSNRCIEWYQALSSVRRSGAPPPLGYDLLLGPNFREKGRNVRRNLEEDRIAVVSGLFQRAGVDDSSH